MYRSLQCVVSFDLEIEWNARNSRRQASQHQAQVKENVGEISGEQPQVKTMSNEHLRAALQDLALPEIIGSQISIIRLLVNAKNRKIKPSLIQIAQKTNLEVMLMRTLMLAWAIF